MSGRGAVRAIVVSIAGVALGAPAPAAALELGELFANPGQRAAARLEAGEYEALVDEAPDAAWEGIGRYASGDAAGAADAFARALETREGEGGLPAAERDALLYNRAVAETRAGRLDEAIAHFDELLVRDPGHADAAHNRDVARALKELEERRQRASDGRGEAGRDDDGAEAEESGQGGQDNQDGQDSQGGQDGQDDSRDGRDGQNNRDGRDGESVGNAPSEGDGSGAEAGGDAADAARARAAAEAALEAERRRAAEAVDATGAAGDEVTAEAGSGNEAIRTPSEREQATEQWLRQIDDDPSGLLRRRLERSHQDDYPEVGDGDEPW